MTTFLDWLRLAVGAVALWLCILSAAVTVCYGAAGVAMVYGLLHGSPWEQANLVRLGFWGAVFVISFIVRNGASRV